MYAQRVRGTSLQLPRGCSKEVGDLLTRLLETLPANRLCTAVAVKKHTWFRNVDFAKVLQKVPQPAFPIFPPISPAFQPDQNFEVGLDLSQSFCRGGMASGTIAGFSKTD